MAVTISDAQATSMARVLAEVVRAYFEAHPEEDARIREEIRRREEEGNADGRREGISKSDS